MSLSHISRFVLWGSVGFILGIGLVSFFVLSINTAFFVIALVCISFIFIFLRKVWLWCFVFFCLMFVVGMATANNSLKEIHYIDTNVGKVETGVAVVVGDIVQKNWQASVKLRYENGVTVILKDEKYTKLNYGSIVNLKCKTALPEMYNNFDYHKYLVMTGVDYFCSDFTYEVIGHDSISGDF